MSNFRMNNALSSSSTLVAVPCEEETVPDADEPPENFDQLFKTKLQLKRTSTDIGFSKLTGQTTSPSQSLLTRAIVTDSESATVQEHRRSRSLQLSSLPAPRRGFSTTSTMSNASAASTADLTSDGGITSPSRTSSPSPPLPEAGFGLGLMAMHHERRGLVAIKGNSDEENDERTARLQQVDHDAVVLALGRKRCISFACRNAEKAKSPEPVKVVVEIVAPAPVKRSCMLKFACSRPVKEVVEEKPQRKLVSPPPPPKFQRRQSTQMAIAIREEEHHRRDSSATIVNGKATSTLLPSLPVPVPEQPSAPVSEAESNKFYEFASSVDDKTEPWMHAPKASANLMKIDCLLDKERRIRQLSEEVDEEAAAEEDDDEEEEASDDDGYMEDDEDDDEEDELWSNSDDDDDDENDDDDDGDECSDEEDFENSLIPSPRPSPRVGHLFNKPLCCRTTSDSSLDRVHHHHISPTRRRSIPNRAPTPELPDSTDFVPGTFDEDKALEEAYVSCLEERKAMKALKKKITPQDIDPSFPTSDPEDDDDDDDDVPASIPSERERAKRSSPEMKGRGRRSSTTTTRRSPLASPKGSRHSPPPPAQRRLRSPPPMSRRTSRQLSPAPVRTSRQLSPALSNHRSPLSGSPSAKQAANGIFFKANPFSRDNAPGLARTKSLPRSGFHPAFLRKRSAQVCPTATSPRPNRGNMRFRGAVDIVEGLERKRLRRKEKHYGKPREWRAEAGQGVEKMRELGILGKERLGAAPAKLIMSI